MRVAFETKRAPRIGNTQGPLTNVIMPVSASERQPKCRDPKVTAAFDG